MSRAHVHACIAAAVAYDLSLDDGVSFACNQQSYSLKRSFRSITTKVREEMNERKKAQGAAPKVMLLNAATCMISLMGPFDGTFSEGAYVHTRACVRLCAMYVLHSCASVGVLRCEARVRSARTRACACVGVCVYALVDPPARIVLCCAVK